MKTMRNEIELRLIGSMLSDWCKQRAEKDDKFIYQSGFDSTYRVIRFATPMLKSLLALPQSKAGYWANGFAAMYEINNAAESVTLSCIASTAGLNKQECKRLQELAASCGAVRRKETYRLAEWNISNEAENVNALTTILDQVMACEVTWFEKELGLWIENAEHKVRAFPQGQHVLVSSSELPEEIYMEGAQKVILANRYERNPKARARCIAIHGSACEVCGFDFGIVFGEEFSGKIEVHHIKPISKIGEEYIVDPVRDLVPVCPNCHMMLHSKKDGVFSIDELRELMKSK